MRNINGGTTGNESLCSEILSTFDLYLRTAHVAVILLDTINFQTTFFSFFYTSAAIVTITTGLIYENKNTHVLLAEVLPHPVAMKMVLIGTALSVITFVS